MKKFPQNLSVGNDPLTIPIGPGSSSLDPTTVVSVSLRVVLPDNTQVTWPATVVPTPWDPVLLTRLAKEGTMVDPTTDIIIEHVWAAGDLAQVGGYVATPIITTETGVLDVEGDPFVVEAAANFKR